MTFIAGTFALVVALGISGFAVSRRLGWIVLAAALIALFRFVWCAWELAQAAS